MGSKVPLESVYPVMWLDAMRFKVCEHGKVVSKAVYNILGVNRDGDKQVLGIYFGDNESSSFRKINITIKREILY